MNHKLSNETVAGLPLHEGRAELLEEIMSTPVIDVVRSDSQPPRRSRRWAAVVAAAAAVAVIAAVPTYLMRDSDAKPGGAERNGAAAGQVDGDRVRLTAPGWSITHGDGSATGGEVTYSREGQSIEINWRPAASYASYVEDREGIDYPRIDPGQPIEVLDRPATLWAYDATDHTALRSAQGEHFLEVRGSGMDKDAFRTLLDALAWQDEQSFQESLPEEHSQGGKQDVVLSLMADMPWPPNWDFLRPEGTTREDLGRSAAGSVTCGWLSEFLRASRAGEQGKVDKAVSALSTSREWSVLRDMAAAGSSYPAMVWEYADLIAAGKRPAGYRTSLGCTE